MLSTIRNKLHNYGILYEKTDNIPANKMLADYRQTDSRFDQKMSADWHQLQSHSFSVLSTEPIHIVTWQIGNRNRAESAAFIDI